MKKTKIVATLGPVTSSVESIQLLLDRGVNIVRLNGAHNTLEWHEEIIGRVRNLDSSIPILMDLPGRKIRTVNLPGPIQFKKGSRITFTANETVPEEFKVAVTYADLSRDLKIGDVILADDATLEFLVKEVRGTDIVCEARCDGVLQSCKGLNIPYVSIQAPLLSERDLKIIEFCIAKGVDFIGLSFVESLSHIQQVREIIKGSNLNLVSKVENQFGIQNLDEIVANSDAILIDRGDLGAETNVEKVGVLQKEIFRTANSYGTPVIVATQVLHTMVENPFPTKAEVTDITNAVLDGASALMLSAETAAGKFPVEAVSLLSRVLKEAESYEYKNSSVIGVSPEKSIPNALGRAVKEICSEISITKIVCISYTGYAAKLISRYRPNQPIIAVTNKIERARKLNVLWGVKAEALNIDFNPSQVSHVMSSLQLLWQRGLLTGDDRVVVVYAKHPPKGGKMNALEIHSIEDLIQILNWK